MIKPDNKSHTSRITTKSLNFTNKSYCGETGRRMADKSLNHGHVLNLRTVNPRAPHLHPVHCSAPTEN